MINRYRQHAQGVTSSPAGAALGSPNPAATPQMARTGSDRLTQLRAWICRLERCLAPTGAGSVYLRCQLMILVPFLLTGAALCLFSPPNTPQSWGNPFRQEDSQAIPTGAISTGAIALPKRPHLREDLDLASLEPLLHSDSMIRGVDLPASVISRMHPGGPSQADQGVLELVAPGVQQGLEILVPIESEGVEVDGRTGRGLVGLVPAAGGSELAREHSAIMTGRDLFLLDWSKHLPSLGGDGLGPLFNATSCAACHWQGGLGGGGPLANNVQTVSLTGRGIARASGGTVASPAARFAFSLVSDQELQKLSRGEISVPTPAIPVLHRQGRHRNYQRWRAKIVQLAAAPRNQAVVLIGERNTPALFGTGLIDRIPEPAIEEAKINSWMANPHRDPIVGRLARLPDGRIGRFGWRGERASLADFVRGACAMELGLHLPENPQPSPTWDTEYVQPTGYDMTENETAKMVDFVANLPRPIEVQPVTLGQAASLLAGRLVFHNIGCAACHRPSLGDLDGLYSDLLLHDMGTQLSDTSSGYGASPPTESSLVNSGSSGDENVWQTPPLWGVANSAPYMHDGRASNLHQAILMHGGEAKNAQQRYSHLTPAARQQLLSFLLSLRAPK